MGAHRLVVHGAGAAKSGVVAVQDLLVGARHRCAHRVALPEHGVEVAHHKDLLAGGILPQEGDDALLGVIGDDPLEAFPAVVHLPEGGVLFVEAVQALDVVLQLGVLVVAQQHPVQLLCLVPLGELTKLLSHEQQLLAGVCHHVAKEGPQVGKLVVVLSGHLIDEAPLTMDHLIVADGQYKVLAEGVEEAEGDLVVVAGAEQGVGLHVAEHVVHPAHVPLEVKAQTAIEGRLGDHRPGGGLLGDHALVGVATQHRAVELAQERHSLQILLAAVLVGLPLALLAVVVQIQHGCHCIHPQTVDMVLLQPVQGAGDQKALHLVATKVEHHGAPLFMLATLGVGILVARLPVKIVQTKLVLGEVGGHPVHDDPDACSVHLIHKCHQVLGGAVAAGGCKIAGDLIAPAAVKGIFHDRQQFHMGVAHFGDIRDQLIRQLGIVVGLIPFLHLPAAGVHLVDVHRTIDHVRLFLLCLPCFIVPPKSADIVDLAAVGRAGLGVERIGICLVHQIPCPGGHAVFIDIVFLHAGNKQLPYRIPIHLAHGMAARLPAVKIAHNADRRCVRCPDTENNACLTGTRFQMCTKVAIRLAVVALFKQIHRQIRCIALNLLFGRSHSLLLSVQPPKSGTVSFYYSILKNFAAIFKAFPLKFTIIFSGIFLCYIHTPQFFTRNIV